MKLQAMPKCQRPESCGCHDLHALEWREFPTLTPHTWLGQICSPFKWLNFQSLTPTLK